jgi:subtilisin family serine protease
LPACPAGTTPPNCRILFTGTSPAAALVAGTASLMLTVNAGLTPAAVAQMLYASTDDIKDPKEGHGRLNAQRAVALAAGDPAPQPALPLPRAIQFVAIAYTNSGATLPVAPAIVNSYFKSGVPVNADGTFRVADVSAASLPQGVTSYKIAVWVSYAGDGKVHPGDYFTSVSCSINSSCSGSLTSLTAKQLAAGTAALP